MPVKRTIKGTQFEISKAPSTSSKKLKATYNNVETGRKNTILFGQKGYQHYKDCSGLLPKSQSHADEQRRANYRSRHRNDNLNKPSAGMLSYYCLW